MAPNCEKPKDKHECVLFEDFKYLLDNGCPTPRCFTFKSFEPEKELLEKKMSLPRLPVPQKIKEAPPELELPPIAPITTPVVSVLSKPTEPAKETPISQTNPLLGAFLIAAVSSIGIPMLKDFVKSKMQKKEDDQPIECKPAQVKTNKKLKELSGRLEKLEDKIGVDIDNNSMDEIKERLSKLENKV